MNKQQRELLNTYDKIPEKARQERIEFLHTHMDDLQHIGGDLYAAWRIEAEATIGFDAMLKLEEKVFNQ